MILGLRNPVVEAVHQHQRDVTRGNQRWRDPLVPAGHRFQTLTGRSNFDIHGRVVGVTECEAGWMSGWVSMGPAGGGGTMRGDRRVGGGFGGPAVLLGRAVVQSVVGLGQRGPACLVNIQRADGLIPQAHRAGRGTERSGRKGRRRASGASHLSHAAHATVKNETKQPPQPRKPQTNRQKQQ